MTGLTEKKWQAHVDAWTASGLSGRKYAAQAGVNAQTLAGWKSRLSRKKPAQAPEPVRFVELAVEPAATGDAGVLELIVGGVVVRVRGRVEEDALARVLAVLEARR